MSDIIDKLRQRDPQVIASVVQDHTEVLLRAAWALGCRNTDAEDLVQETLTAFLTALDRFQGTSSVRTYLLGILYHKAQQKRRIQGRELVQDPIDEIFENRFGTWGLWRTLPRGPEEESLAQETALLLDDCINTLPPAQRMAFYLREVENATPEAVCNVLGLNVTHLRVLLFRARNKLRECVQRRWSGASA